MRERSLRILFKEYRFYFNLGKDFNMRHDVTDMNFREAIAVALWKMVCKGLRTQS